MGNDLVRADDRGVGRVHPTHAHVARAPRRRRAAAGARAAAGHAVRRLPLLPVPDHRRGVPHTAVPGGTESY